MWTSSKSHNCWAGTGNRVGRMRDLGRYSTMTSCSFKGMSAPCIVVNGVTEKHPAPDLADFMVLPVVAAVILGQDHVVHHRPPLLTIDPQQYLGLGQALLHIEVIAMQGHAAIPVRRAGKERMRKLADQLLLAVRTPLGFSQNRARNGWVKAVFEQSLVGSRIVRLDEGLMGLFQLDGALAQGKLVVV